MIVKGERVKVLDSYSGGLEDVKGRYGKVVDVWVGDDGMMHVLDIEGKRVHNYSSGSYTRKYPVLAKSDEISVEPIPFFDKNGNLVELGDKVVYACHGGYLLDGTVVDMKDMVYPQYGDPYVMPKIKIESDYKSYTTDGGDRKAHYVRKVTQWVSSQDSTLIVQKGALKEFLKGGFITFNGEEKA